MEPSFGEADTYLRAEGRHSGNASSSDLRTACTLRHKDRLHEASLVRKQASRIFEVDCRPGRTRCHLGKQREDEHVALVSEILRTAFGDRGQALSSTNTTLAVSGRALARVPTLWTPAVLSPRLHASLRAEIVTAPNEFEHYLRKYRNDHWLCNAVVVYEKFFKHERWRGDSFFFIESGGNTGRVDGANSHLFERYLGWQGLLVEPQHLLFAQLATARPLAYRLNSALCNTTEPLESYINDFGIQHGARGRGTRVRSTCVPLGRMLRSIPGFWNATNGRYMRRVDFWSLDVDGFELDVLRGMDWDVPVGVMLIETVTPAIRSFLRERGFVRYHFRGQGAQRDQIWHHPSYAPVDSGGGGGHMNRHDAAATHDARRRRHHTL